MRRTLILGVLLLLLALGFVFRTPATDWLRQFGYTPDAGVRQLTSEDGFTPTATHLFYINRPAIYGKTDFAEHCNSHAEQTIVLGCYHGVQHGIYVLKVSGDTRLQGVMQVTAAHEMLHAAYDRLSKQERSQVNGWLLDYYNNGLHDARIRSTIDEYKQSEPGAVVNEMHSIFGTEVMNLPPNLENYYKRYFSDRAAIATEAQSYQAEFVSRQAQVKADDTQLAAWKTEINTDEADLKQQYAAINQASAEMDQLKSSGQYDAYNARVDAYNRQVGAYTAIAASTKQLISRYNDLVQSRNDLVLQAQRLTEELRGDSVPAVSAQ